MTALSLLVAVLGLALAGWLAGRARAAAFAGDLRRRTGSRPGHYGWYVAAWSLFPTLLLLAVWAITSPMFVTRAVLASPSAAALPTDGFERASILAEARALAAADVSVPFHPASRRLAPAYAAARGHSDLIASIAALALAFANGSAALLRVRPALPARRRVERGLTVALFAASLVAMLTTLGIFLSLFWEAGRFFAAVPVADFLFGTRWSPQAIGGTAPAAGLGALPLFWGTFLIGAVIAMAVAAPLGLLSAVYLSEYAAPATRTWAKPTLEILAGIPTVVYGAVAALFVAPAMRDLGIALGVADASSESALGAGLVIGVMIVPFVSSMADDALASVASPLREASLALGATPSETIRRVLIPAALPGIAGGLLLGVSRAIGETVIVVMAASSVAVVSANPFAPATTVTRQIVDLLTGEAAFDSPKTLAAFALGLTLFLATLVLNVAALALVRRHEVRHA